jgi:hypothetical protein
MMWNDCYTSQDSNRAVSQSAAYVHNRQVVNAITDMLAEHHSCIVTVASSRSGSEYM